MSPAGGSISVPSPPTHRPPLFPLPFPLVIACVDLHAILLVVSIATTTKRPKDNRGALGGWGSPRRGFDFKNELDSTACLAQGGSPSQPLSHSSP